MEPRVPTEPGYLLPWALATCPGAHCHQGSFQEVRDQPEPGSGWARHGVGPWFGASSGLCSVPGSLSQHQDGRTSASADQLGRAVYLLLRFVTGLSIHPFFLPNGHTVESFPDLRNNGLHDSGHSCSLSLSHRQALAPLHRVVPVG